ncbi:MAG: glycosyl transferase family 2 [Roseitalea sp.]|jgi:glycosyltransferase involved in cell wall biosynthesis|nr:glycosyl transferase family 2 [Roseitalea sp.]MBO6721725.1 glycosyl transferase family 2 [Roseitalea sp.]MBO6743486.1 glycosyl transferase family 2 [Roseitalea sp.]
MLSVLVPTHNNEDRLAQMLPDLVRHAVSGAISDVIVLDGGSSDETVRVGEIAGCTIIDASGADMPAVLDAARGLWLLILPPGARLVGDWLATVEAHINAPAGAAGAARFRLARDPGLSLWARLFKRRGPAGPFGRGFLISKAQAQALSRPGMTLDALPRGVAVRTLRAGLLPPASR